jgi:hypothetical protein
MPRPAWPVGLLLLVFLALPARAAPVVSVELLEIDPAESSALPLNATLYGRIRYRTEGPVRLVLRPYRGGREVQEGWISSGSPTYPAGSGEALAWFAFRAPGGIDEVRAQAVDGGGIVFAEAVLGRSIDWYDGAGAAPPPAPWVEPLRQAGEALMAEARREAQDMDAGGLLLMQAVFWLVPISIILQIVAWRKLGGIYGRLARGSALAMAALWLFVIVTALTGSNLSPIWLVFLSPLFVLFLAALFAMQYFTRHSTA